MNLGRCYDVCVPAFPDVRFVQKLYVNRFSQSSTIVCLGRGGVTGDLHDGQTWDRPLCLPAETCETSLQRVAFSTGKAPPLHHDNSKFVPMEDSFTYKGIAFSTSFVCNV